MKLSIIIPLGPAEPVPIALLQGLAARTSETERIVAVTETHPAGTIEGIQPLRGKAGRGCQQNQAAAAACGEWLWFLHADSVLPDDALDKVLGFVASQKAALGYCRLRFASDGPRLAGLNGIGANLRSRWLGLPYGDQGLCLPRAWFFRLDGFREDLDRGEDLDLVVRARRAGLKVRPIDTTIMTSSRRYRDHGWLRTTLRHQLAAVRLIRQAR